MTSQPTARLRLEQRSHVLQSLAAEADNIARRVVRQPCTTVEFRRVFEDILLGLAINEYNAMKAPWVAKLTEIATLTLPKYLYDRMGNVKMIDDGMTPHTRSEKAAYIAHIEAIRLEVFGPTP